MKVDEATIKEVAEALEVHKRDASIVVTESSILVQRGEEEIGKLHLDLNIGTVKNKDEESIADVRPVIGALKWKAKMLTYLRRM